MKIKKIRTLKVNSYTFKVNWTNDQDGARFSFADLEICIGTKDINGKSRREAELFVFLCHELMEICAIEMNVRLSRPDCQTDYIFCYDHRQHETMTNMFAGLLSQFL